MNSSCSTTFAISMALMLLGSSAISATTDYSHPQFTVADDRTLSLRETSSRIVMETIEDAIRQGGLALFDEDFQIDSSLNWVFGERIEGEVDVVVPLWSGDGHVVFAQPGLALWTGMADEDRIDTNIGMVYRTNLLSTLTGIDLISGVSVFYDNNFRRGHSRVSIGVDAQHNEFLGTFNYYQPLSDDKRGRTGFIENAVRGMDARLAFQRDIMRLSGNLGYWRYEGIEAGKSEWELSYGLDASVQIVDGVFIEGGYERHDNDVSIGDRLNLGVAFRFSLPDFKGKSYKNELMSSNLYQIVKREKRILYEERESDGIILSINGDGNVRNVSIELRKATTEDLVLNFIGTDSSATYNDDWVMSVGGTDCPMVTDDHCQITIIAGETRADDEVVITFQDPARGEPAEEIILSMEVASGGGANLALASPLVVRIPAGEPLPTVSLNYGGSRTIDGNSIVRQTIELSEVLSDSITVTLTAGGTADYDTNLEIGTWNLSHATVTAGMMPADTFPFSDADLCSNTAIMGTGCEIIISAGQTVVDLAMNSKSLTSGETIDLTLGIGSASTSLVALGNSSGVNFVIEAPPLPTVTMSTSDTSIMEGLQRLITFTLSEAVDEEVTLNLIADTSGSAMYGSSNDWVLNDGSGACTSASGTSCQITIPANNTTATINILVIDDMTTERAETAVLRVEVDSGSTHLVQEGSPSSLTFNIQATQHTVSFRDSTGTATEEDTNAGTIISITPKPIEPVNIPLTVMGDSGSYTFRIGTLTNPIPYENNMFVFPADSGSVTLVVTAPGDDNNINETVTVTLGNTLPDNFSIGANDTWTVTIDDNDMTTTTPTGGTLGFELGEVSTPETIIGRSVVRLRGELKDSNGTRITTLPVNLPFRLTVTNNDDNDVSVDLGNLELQGSLVSFNQSGFISPFVEVTINDDEMPEEDETFTVTLHKRGNFPNGWDIDANNNSVDIIILANDQPATPTGMTLGFAETGITTDETIVDGTQFIQIRGVAKDATGMKLSSIPVRLPITLSIANNGDNDIVIDTSPGLALTPTGTTDFNSDNEFLMQAIQITDDIDSEPQEEFVITLGEGPNFPSGWSVDTSANTITITINASDQRTISFSGGSGTQSTPGTITDAIDEGTGSSATVTLNISPTPTENINIPLTVTGDHTVYGDSIVVSETDTSGATVQGKPSTNDVMVSVPANTGMVILKMTAVQESDNAADDITVSLGTLPDNYTAGTINTWTVTISFPPTVNFVYEGGHSLKASTNRENAEIINLGLELSKIHNEAITVHLKKGGTADSSNGSYRILNQDDTICGADNEVCIVTFPAGQREAVVKFYPRRSLSGEETAIINITIPKESEGSVQLGMHDEIQFTLTSTNPSAVLPTVTLSFTGNRTLRASTNRENAEIVDLKVQLNTSSTASITVHLKKGGTADSSNGSYRILNQDDTICGADNEACIITFAPNQQEAVVKFWPRRFFSGEETAIIDLEIPAGNRDKVALGLNNRVVFTLR